MERPCSACAPGQTVVKQCGLFKDIECSGPKHTPKGESEQAEVDHIAGIVMLCLLVGIALLVFMSVSTEHELKKNDKSEDAIPQKKKTNGTMHLF